MRTTSDPAWRFFVGCGSSHATRSRVAAGGATTVGQVDTASQRRAVLWNRFIPTMVETVSGQTGLGPTPTVAVYLDGFGRTLQERHEVEPGPAAPSTSRWRVTGWQILNENGQIVDVAVRGELLARGSTTTSTTDHPVHGIGSAPVDPGADVRPSGRQRCSGTPFVLRFARRASMHKDADRGPLNSRAAFSARVPQ